MLGGVTRHMLPHLLGVPHFRVNRPLEFNSRKICQHLTNWTNWNKCDKVWSSANSLAVAVVVARDICKDITVHDKQNLNKHPWKNRFFEVIFGIIQNGPECIPQCRTLVERSLKRLTCMSSSFWKIPFSISGTHWFDFQQERIKGTEKASPIHILFYR